MGVRENMVEAYLHQEVKAQGGTTRKWVGGRGNPDRIVFFYGQVILVEVKTSVGRLTPAQKREHGRLRSHGAIVVTVQGHAGVDDLIKGLTRG